jgi:hypothetical protein
MKQLLIVLSNARDGRDDAFNEWYSYVHIRDVMRSRAAIAVQRFRLADEQLPGVSIQHRYLAIYETDELAGFTDGHAGVFTPEMPISDSFRFDDMREAYYDPIIARKNIRGPDATGDVIIERIAADVGLTDFCDWYADHRFAAVMRLPGIVSGRFTRVAAEQMLAPFADSEYVAVYRTADARRTLEAWADLPAAAWREGAAVTACYTPLIPRLTAHAALHPPPEERERAAAARRALGSRVYHGFPDGLGLR